MILLFKGLWTKELKSFENTSHAASSRLDRLCFYWKLLNGSRQFLVRWAIISRKSPWGNQSENVRKGRGVGVLSVAWNLFSESVLCAGHRDSIPQGHALAGLGTRLQGLSGRRSRPHLLPRGWAAMTLPQNTESAALGPSAQPFRFESCCFRVGAGAFGNTERHVRSPAALLERRGAGQLPRPRDEGEGPAVPVS